MAVARADTTANLIWVETTPKELDFVRLAPGSSWNRDRGWSVPLSWAACLALRGLFGEALSLEQSLIDWSWQEFNGRVKPCLMLLEHRDLSALADYPDERVQRVLSAFTAVEDEMSGQGLALRKYQRYAIVMALIDGQMLLADDMGTGKTVMAAVYLRTAHRLSEDGALPAFVACPNSMKLMWARELRLWFPACTPYPVSGTAVKRRKLLAAAMADPTAVVILNWESLRLHSRLAPYGSTAMKPEEKEDKELQAFPFKAVVLDEAHNMKTPKAKTTRAAWAITHRSGAFWRLALTGTPIADNPADGWGILHCISPHEHPTMTKYVERYVEQSYNWAGYLELGGLKADTAAEFHQIVAPRMRRVTQQEANPDLPPVVEEIRLLEMTDKQAKAYKQLVDHQLVTLEDGMALATNPLTKLTRLSQFASAYGELELTEKLDPETGEMKTHETVHLTDPSNKVDALLEIIEELGPDEPVVACAQSRELVDLAGARLEAKGISVVYVKGGQTVDERQVAVDAFQEGRARVLLFTIAAGSVGLTLTRSRVIVFMQRSWSQLHNAQAQGRVYRVGSEIHDSILVIHLVSADTVEEAQLVVLHEKNDRLEEFVGDKETLARLIQSGVELAPAKTKRTRPKKEKPDDSGGTHLPA